MKSKEKIIFINALSAKLGGGRTYIHNLLSNLDNHSKVYITCPDKSLIPVHPRIEYISTPFANKNIICRAFWELFVLPRLLNKLKTNVLFVPGGMDFTRSNIKQPKVTMFRNMLPFDNMALSVVKEKRSLLKNILLKRLMIRTMNSADHVIFISDYAKNTVIESLKLKAFSTIYHGISLNFTPDLNDTSVTPIEQEYLLYVSRFELYKNHLNVIKAYDKLSPSLKNKYQLVIVGEKMEPSYPRCVEYIRDNKLEEHVTITGKIVYQDLPALYRQAYLTIFASSCENCPNILLEAIGCGSPVIASKTEPMPEFAKTAALYFDEAEPSSIYETLNKVLTSDELRNSMREKSNSLRNEYMWETTARLTWECLNITGEKSV